MEYPADDTMRRRRIDGRHRWRNDATDVVYAGAKVGESDVLSDGRGESPGRVVHPRAVLIDLSAVLPYLAFIICHLITNLPAQSKIFIREYRIRTKVYLIYR